MLRVHITPPSGYTLNGAVPMRYCVEAIDSEGVVRREALAEVHELDGRASKFDIVLPLRRRQGEDRLCFSLAYSIRRPLAAGVAKLRGVIWEIPLRISPLASTDHVRLETPDAR